MTFLAAPEPKAPVTQGWLRVSQRKLDPKRSTECLPYYPHDDPTDRPPERFDGTNTLYTGGARESYLLMPVVS